MILHLYRSSLMKALVDIYPQVKFDKSEFGVLSRMNVPLSPSHLLLIDSSGKTYHASNVRKLFDAFARAQGLDPLVPESWYEVTNELVQNDKVHTSLCFLSALFLTTIQICGPLLDVRFKGNLIQGLCEIYPDLRLQHHKFTKIITSM
jgi:hypothetical protein